MNATTFREAFENLYGKGNPILDELCHEFLPSYKDFSVVFESIYLEPGERRKIDMQIPSELIVNPDILFRFDENEIKSVLERSGLELGEINPPTLPVLLGGWRGSFSFVTPNHTTIKFFTAYSDDPLLELRQQTQPPYESLIRFSLKNDDVKVEICTGEIGRGGTMYYEDYLLGQLLKTEKITLLPEGHEWGLNSKLGHYPLNAARIFQ